MLMQWINMSVMSMLCWNERHVYVVLEGRVRLALQLQRYLHARPVVISSANDIMLGNLQSGLTSV